MSKYEKNVFEKNDIWLCDFSFPHMHKTTTTKKDNTKRKKMIANLLLHPKAISTQYRAIDFISKG